MEIWDALKWLCMLNEHDPAEATKALRGLSEDIRKRPAEPGIHPDLAARAAALTLWLSGQEEDERNANAIDPGLEPRWSYESDYLASPGTSLFALERQHAAPVLSDAALQIGLRLDRTAELWLDPTFRPGGPFVEEIRTFAKGFPVDELDVDRSRSGTDLLFERITPGLARTAPDLLADVIRRKMRGMSGRPRSARFSSTLHLEDHMLLAGPEEVQVARNLGANSPDVDRGNEVFVRDRLLMLEVWSMPALPQWTAIIEAEVQGIPTSFVDILERPTRDEVDALIVRFRDDAPRRRRDLLTLMSVAAPELSESAWSWVEGFINDADEEQRRAAIEILTDFDAQRLGSILLARNWSWVPGGNHLLNHCGSDALIAASRSIPFEEVAPRLAPWKLLEAARKRGALGKEVRLAAGILDAILTRAQRAPDAPESDLIVDRTRTGQSPFSFAIALRPGVNDGQDMVETLRRTLDFEATSEARRRAINAALERVKEVWKAGSSLFLANLPASDFDLLLEHASDVIDNWLDGMGELTVDFRKRLFPAESVYIALCEAMLNHQPERGAVLWRSLHQAMRSRYTGAGRVDDLVHMVFRVNASPPVLALRTELTKLSECHTDQSLFDLAVAAVYNGCSEWLDQLIESDAASPLAWQRRRAVVLAGFKPNHSLPLESAWPNGPVKSNFQELDRVSSRAGWRDACARHWWRQFLRASDADTAYAAWTLFARAADRRADLWLRSETEAIDRTSTFMQSKLRYAQVNIDVIDRNSNRGLDKLSGQFLGRKTVDGIGPWTRDG